MGGKEVVSIIKQKNPKLKVIISSGYSEDTVWNLLNSAQVLFASHEALVADAEQEVVLDEDEIKELSAKSV